MDKFLFRGKSIDGNHRWILGHFVDHNGTPVIHVPEEKYYDCREYTVIRETLGQCTGLKDKNGKLIFDGDIINAKILYDSDIQFIVFKIVWQDYSWKAIKLCKTESKYDTDSVWFSELVCPDYFDSIEIIGNIYDNPELLKTT